MPRWLIGVLLVLAVYFPAAWWAHDSYVDLVPKGATILYLSGPFTWEDGFAWWVPISSTGDFTIYEDGRPMAREESYQTLTAIPGRFLHDGPRLLISTRGNPNSSGHHYWAVK